ncbi:DEAD/DEAH box helicase [Burkholderia pyrrocinia]|uniref:DEAD/DEAH box helicase n=1 Tax=Burkholderia pyrrocinia TaxID=60550 RepID=UPI00215A8936|nr:DEAD/DEAH box helicase [Burkholderia pyrrocinia]UVE66925.1 DEAD/DEAH box helicase [Burkholderia pyrrocinia]
MSRKQELIVTSFAKLTDFQQATVDAVMQRFDGAQQNRVLVADEVGLGKTVVARGVIATMLQRYLSVHGEEPARPLRVTYICSNQTLADENRRKLAIFTGKDAAVYVQAPTFWRLAELGVARDYDGRGKLIEVCTLTPATSFGVKRRGTGNAKERYIIFRALAEHPRLSGSDLVALENFFRQGVGASWRPGDDGWPSAGGIVHSVRDAFHASLGGAVPLSPDDIAELDEANVPHGDWFELLLGSAALCSRDKTTCSSAFNRMLSELRLRFMHACAGNLEADLFILDEFQRFKELLGRKDDSEDGIIAHKVFEETHEGAGKVLLLSATPYKALTHIDDEEEAHAEQLKYLLRFLVNGEVEPWEKYAKAREALLTEILRLRDPSVRPTDLSGQPKKDVEAALRPYICRTERASIGSGVENVTRASHLACTTTFSRAEIDAFVAFDKVGQVLHDVQPSIHHLPLMDFYKSAPWPLSFLGDYKLRAHIESNKEVPEVKAALSRANAAWIPRDDLDNYAVRLGTHAPHAKLREVTNAVFGSGAEMLLWVPPSRPYYNHEGPFAANAQFTKTLLFSSLLLAPRALSGLISYEAERRLLRAAGDSAKYFEDRPGGDIVRFDNPKTLAPWGLVYPSRTLCNLAPVRDQALGQSSGALVVEMKRRLAEGIHRLQRFTGSAPRHPDLWYALAPLLLDWTDDTGADAAHNVLSPRDACRQWLVDFRRDPGQSTDATGRRGVIDAMREWLENPALDLGPMPDDLPSFLAKLAIAGPAVSLLTSLERTWGKNDRGVARLAGVGAIDFVQVFNNPEGRRILKVGRRDRQSPFWMAALDYCVAGNLQAMFDEYLHLLHSNGLSAIDAMARLNEAARLRGGSVTAQVRRANGTAVRFRCHFAVSISNQRSADQQAVERIGNVRDAFNSPFWPFMLNSTSIGQEGLDFHWYCSRVVHWNLPPNPIDLEQREGRVNRYKSLVVRRRVAEYCAGTSVTADGGDVWAAWFEHAKSARKYVGDSGASDLVPYWHMPSGQSRIERFVPFLPMSREATRLDELLKILSLYRLAFGQPRQQELLENLLRREFDTAEIAEIKRKLMIDLAPLNYLRKAPDSIEISNDDSAIVVTKPLPEDDTNAPFGINRPSSHDEQSPGAET